MTIADDTVRTRYTSFFNRMGIVAVFAMFAWLSTTFIRIPTPVSGGYFNIGDAFVMVAAIFFGPITGALVGLIGPTMADFIGYVQFVPATATIKTLEGLAVGLIGFRKGGVTASRCATALVVGGIIIVVGYFVAEAYVYPYLATFSPFFDATNMAMAYAEIVPNIFQAVISAILAFGMWKLLGGTRNAANA